MISSDESSRRLMADWIAERTMLSVSLMAGSLKLSGRGEAVLFDGEKLVVGHWLPSGEVWAVEICPQETAELSSTFSEDDPLGSVVVVLRFGSTVCTLEGNKPPDVSLAPPDF
jgi:hypothetical protein